MPQTKLPANKPIAEGTAIPTAPRSPSNHSIVGCVFSNCSARNDRQEERSGGLVRRPLERVGLLEVGSGELKAYGVSGCGGAAESYRRVGVWAYRRV